MSALPRQVDYSRNIDHVARYRYLQVPLSNNPSGSLIMSNTSTLQAWKLPAGVVYNLSRSKISYTCAVLACGANLRNFLNDDAFSIAQQLSLVTSTGTVIADIPFCNRYTHLIDKYVTRKADFLSRDVIDLNYPCNDAIAVNKSNLSICPANAYGIAIGAQATGFVNYTEPQYYRISLQNAGGLNSAMSFAKYQTLGQVGRNTLFEQDKDLYFDKEMYLNLQTAPVDEMAFTSDSGDLGGTIASVTAINNAVTLNNIMLHLAIEDNAIISESVIGKYQSGIQLRTDYLMSFRNILSAPVSNVNIQLPQMANCKLKKVINAVFPTSQVLDKTYDSVNVNGVKIASYQSNIDSQPLQNNYLTCAWTTGTALGNTDYRDNERFIKGSAIDTIPVYQLNWCHVDSFSGDDPTEGHFRIEDKQNHEYGLDMNTPHNYLLAMNTPNAAGTNLSQYSFCVLSRILHCGRDDIRFIA